MVTREAGRTSWLAAAARARPEPFGTPERVSFVRALVPHLQQAVRVQTRLFEADRRYRDAVAAIDVLADGMVIVGGDGRVIYGLTKTEAEVALRVLGGTGLKPIADEMSMSLSTVRTHLQHVFDPPPGRVGPVVARWTGGHTAARYAVADATDVTRH